MKKNINNKIYDTETSSELQKRTINPASRDCTITETLYKAQDGDFFLTHDITGGGTYSFESEWCLKHDVCPLTIEQAKE